MSPDQKTTPKEFWDYPDETPDETQIQRLLADVRRPRRKKTITVYKGNLTTGQFELLKPARPVGLVLNETTAEEIAVVLGSKEASWHTPLVKQPSRRQFNKMPNAEEFKKRSRRAQGRHLGHSYPL